MDPLLFTLIAEEMSFTPHTLKPTFPLARVLYAKDNHIPEEMEETHDGI